MCFSASASFTASGILSAIGVRNLTAVKKRSQRMFASIPFIFALQQTCEGFLWLSFTNTALAPYKQVCAYGFLFVAFMLWPVWIPLSVCNMENDGTRKKYMLFPLVAGISFALFLFGWLAYFGVTVSIADQHIWYDIDMPYSLLYCGTLLYLFATIAPFYISSTKYAPLFGTCLGALYIIAYIFYYQTLVSVWCFFAAVLSILISIILRR